MPRRSNASILADLQNQLLNQKAQIELLSAENKRLVQTPDASGQPPKEATRDEIEKAVRNAPSMVLPADGDVPGSYKRTGTYPNGEPILTKVAWTRATIEKYFGLVTFIPPTSRSVLFDGVRYDLRGEVENTVPTCIKDIYENARKGEKIQPYPPLGMQEEHKSIQDAAINKYSMTRPHLIGTGPLGPDE